MIEDNELLRQYCDTGSEEAFGELTRRHVNLVYSVALRQVGYDEHLAQDVSQEVFSALARQADTLGEHVVLGGWLSRSSLFIARNLMRNTRRRRVREREAQEMYESEKCSDAEVDWERARPILDEVIGELGERDRNAVWLRYFESKGYAEIGKHLSLNENSARMRVNRALGKLNVLVGRRGIKSTTGIIATILAGQGGAAAPVGLATTVTQGALASAAATMGLSGFGTFIGIMNTTKIAFSTAAVVTAAALGTAVYQTQQLDRVERDLLRLASESTAHSERANSSTTVPDRDRGSLDQEPTRLIEDGGRGSEIFDVSRIDEYLAKIETLPAGPNRQREMETLFRKWGTASGGLAYEAAKALEGRDRLACMSAAVAGWSVVSPENAWSEIMLATNNGSTSEPKLRPIIEEIAKNDLRLAVQLLQGIDNRYYLQQHFEPLIDAAAENRSYVDLLSILESMDSTDTRGLLAEKVFETWGRYELDAPLEAMRSIGDSAVAPKALLGFMRGWAQVDGQAAFLYVVENSSDPEIAEMIAPVAEQWALSSTRDEVASLIEQVMEIGDGGMAFSHISRSLVQRQPELTMDSLSGITNDRARSMTTDMVMGEWARSDLASAEGYYREMSYDPVKQQSFWALFNASMQQSKPPQGIIDLAFELGDSEAVNRSLVSMAEYASLSPIKDRAALALENALLRELVARDGVSEESKAKVLEWLKPDP